MNHDPVREIPVSDSSIDQQIGARTVTAAAWLVVVRLLTKSIDFIALLIFARLLNPADFGLVAMAMTLVFIVEAVLELPINQVLVRQRTITRSQLDTAFTLALLRGCIIAAMLALAAYPFSFIYGDYRLVGLVLALGWAPMVRGLASPKLAVYAQQINFSRDLVIDLSGKLVSLAISVALAWQTHSYWALVVGTVVTPMVMVATSYLVAPYRPRLTLSEWPIFANFAGWSTVTQMLSALSFQADRLILGRFATRHELGTFTLANDLSNIPEQALIKPIMRPLMSAFARMNDNPERLRQFYQRASVGVLAVGTPVILGLCLLADPIVRLALGGKWLLAIPILHLLPLSLIPPLLTAPFWSLAMAVGRPRLYALQALFDLVMRTMLLLTGALVAGVGGVIIARIAASLLSVVSATWCVRSITGASVLRQFAATWRVVLASAALAGSVYWLRSLTEAWNGFELALALGLIVAVGATVYFVVLLASWRLAGAPEGLESWCVGHISRRLGRQKTPGFAYLLLPADRWRQWHESGVLPAQAGDLGDQDMLLSASQVVWAVGTMAGRLHASVLVQVDLPSVGLPPRQQVPSALPLAGVRRFYYLRDLIDPVTHTHEDSNVVPLRRYGTGR